METTRNLPQNVSIVSPATMTMEFHTQICKYRICYIKRNWKILVDRVSRLRFKSKKAGGLTKEDDYPYTAADDRCDSKKVQPFFV